MLHDSGNYAGGTAVLTSKRSRESVKISFSLVITEKSFRGFSRFSVKFRRRVATLATLLQQRQGDNGEGTDNKG
jgi:hypothetical protein